MRPLATLSALVLTAATALLPARADAWKRVEEFGAGAENTRRGIFSDCTPFSSAREGGRYETHWGKYDCGGEDASEWFVYANNNPLRWTDPDGRCSREELARGECDDIYRAYEGLVGELYQSDIEAMSEEERVAAIQRVTTYRTLQEREYAGTESVETLCGLLDCRRGRIENWKHRLGNSAFAGRVTGALSAYEEKWASLKEGTQELVKGTVYNALDRPGTGGLGNRLNQGLSDAATVPTGLAVDAARVVTENKAIAVVGAAGTGALGRTLAKDAAGLAQYGGRAGFEMRAVRWTAHGGKHVASAKVPWGDVVESTRRGAAKYLPGTDIEALERRIWAEGVEVSSGRPWKVMELAEEVGASEGKASRWVRVEESGGTIHGHPISEAEFKKLTRQR